MYNVGKEPAPTGANVDGPCWIWMRGLNADGYGQTNKRGKNVRSHRVAYEMFVGLIPDGLQIDHLCRVRRCVNPEHLEPVTAQENTLRGVGLAGIITRTGQCFRGHTLAEDECVTGKRRGCRQCVAVVAANKRKAVRSPATCGTPAAAARHRRQGEPLCGPCRKAESDYGKAWNLARNGPRKLKPCGTPGALERHRLAGDPPCEVCRTARSIVRRARDAERRHVAAAGRAEAKIA